MIIFLSLFVCSINVVLCKADSREIIVSKAQLCQKDWHVKLSLVSLLVSVLKHLVHQWLVNEPKADFGTSPKASQSSFWTHPLGLLSAVWAHLLLPAILSCNPPVTGISFLCKLLICALVSFLFFYCLVGFTVIGNCSFILVNICRVKN